MATLLNKISFECQEIGTPLFFDTYQEHGVVIVRNVIEDSLIQCFKRNIEKIMCSLLPPKKGRELEDIDSLYQELAQDEELSRKIIPIARDLPEFYQWMCHPQILSVVKKLLPDTLLQIVHDICLFRIDPPILNHFRKFDWHQDYPYNTLSQSAVTAWIPVTSIQEDMGPLKIIPGSHHNLLPICFQTGQAGGQKGSGHKVFSLANAEEQNLNERCIQVTNIQAGDAVFFNSLLLHASGDNCSQEGRSRWVFNYRYGDLLDKEVVDRKWRVVRDRDPYCFTEIHPHLVRS